jgi:hypothetical protein
MAKKVTKKAGLNKAATQAYNNELMGGRTANPSRPPKKKVTKKVTKAKPGMSRAATQAYNNELAGGNTANPSRPKKVTKKVSGARKAQNALNESVKKSKSRADAMKKGNYGRMHYK